jgi:hypothetical protein
MKIKINQLIGFLSLMVSLLLYYLGFKQIFFLFQLITGISLIYHMITFENKKEKENEDGK